MGFYSFKFRIPPKAKWFTVNRPQ